MGLLVEADIYFSYAYEIKHCQPFINFRQNFPSGSFLDTSQKRRSEIANKFQIRQEIAFILSRKDFLVCLIILVHVILSAMSIQKTGSWRSWLSLTSGFRLHTDFFFFFTHYHQSLSLSYQPLTQSHHLLFFPFILLSVCLVRDKFPH